MNEIFNDCVFVGVYDGGCSASCIVNGHVYTRQNADEFLALFLDQYTYRDVKSQLNYWHKCYPDKHIIISDDGYYDFMTKEGEILQL